MRIFLYYCLPFVPTDCIAARADLRRKEGTTIAKQIPQPLLQDPSSLRTEGPSLAGYPRSAFPHRQDSAREDNGDFSRFQACAHDGVPADSQRSACQCHSLQPERGSVFAGHTKRWYQASPRLHAALRNQPLAHSAPRRNQIITCRCSTRPPGRRRIPTVLRYRCTLRSLRHVLARKNMAAHYPRTRAKENRQGLHYSRFSPLSHRAPSDLQAELFSTCAKSTANPRKR
jgi:hypothetical protein